ncbi:MAG TPA: 50S ribosomal protein L35 [Candidatus Omnitrophota bacterium]|nr:50S ribosomal protein L35 [Candidatus Omnitrophota bacterium]HPT07174.1 50S ribosomal protein L35 [Candidatus Omnitrophota bacterium]
MGKLKTKKGVAKRFRTTKSGKVKYNTCGKSHLNSSKNTKRMRKLRHSKTLDDAKTRNFVKRMLPYG